jgi:iron complex outermembrane receptor protein
MRILSFLFLALFSLSAAFSQTTDTLGSHLQDVVVSGIKAGEKMPVTQTTLTQKKIEERYYGADIPSVLSTTPSINSYSDNGTGMGYSYFRLAPKPLPINPKHASAPALVPLTATA